MCDMRRIASPLRLTRRGGPRRSAALARPLDCDTATRPRPRHRRRVERPLQERRHLRRRGLAAGRRWPRRSCTRQGAKAGAAGQEALHLRQVRADRAPRARSASPSARPRRAAASMACCDASTSSRCAVHEDHAVVVVLGQPREQERDDLHGLAAGRRQPRRVAVLVERLDRLELEVALRVADVGRAHAVDERRARRRRRASASSSRCPTAAGPRRRRSARRSAARRTSAPIIGAPRRAPRLPPGRYNDGPDTCPVDAHPHGQTCTTRARGSSAGRAAAVLRCRRRPSPTSAPAPASR